MHTVASYPGHVGGGKSGPVSTVCACASDSGNPLRTSHTIYDLQCQGRRKDFLIGVGTGSCVCAAMASIIRQRRRKMFLIRGAGLLDVLRKAQMCGPSPQWVGGSGGMPPGKFLKN